MLRWLKIRPILGDFHIFDPNVRILNDNARFQDDSSVAQQEVLDFMFGDAQVGSSVGALGQSVAWINAGCNPYQERDRNGEFSHGVLIKKAVRGFAFDSSLASLLV